MIDASTILEKLSEAEKKDANVIFGGAFMGHAAFVIEHIDKRPVFIGEYQAWTESALRQYELLLKINSKDHESDRDDLISR